jgi:predicted nucleotidyltransferase
MRQAAMLTQQRRNEVRSVVQTVHRWADEHDDVRGVVVVGSWARDAARMDSDVDIVVLTDTFAHTDPQMWMQLLDGQVDRLEQWGPLREVRLQRRSGLVVEMGIVPLDWANTDPVDAGTYRVINDGHRIVCDPDGTLAALTTACP